MKNGFIMRAPTVDGSWFSFYIEDCPSKLSEETFVLLNKPGTPIMYCDVFRGDAETGLFEGDIILCEGRDWLICYDRGFYAINRDYQIKYLFQLKDWRHLGVADHDMHFPIKYARRKHHLFCHLGGVFSLWGIQDCTDEGVLLTDRTVVKSSDIHQEVCATWNKRRMYLGYIYDNKVLELNGGRLSYSVDNKCYDIFTGGELIGYIRRSDGREGV